MGVAQDGDGDEVWGACPPILWRYEQRKHSI